jgi:glycosyltransferase involved in cell wall biosynthesis
MISAVITTYKEPEALDLCLRSAIEGQKNKNQIIVVVDGFYDINAEVLDKYQNDIEILNLEENVGMIRAMNFGHMNAKYDLVFHVQDDNVFPFEWDINLEKSYRPNSVLSPNQIEPTPSMFKQFHIKDMGRDPRTFDLGEYQTYCNKLKDVRDTYETGSTFPFLISKIDYLKIGGFDESYPGPWVVDWEFFLKCRLNGMKMLRSYNSHFYHFVSLGTRTPEKVQENQRIEQECHIYGNYKWGTSIKHNSINNEKYL